MPDNSDKRQIRLGLFIHNAGHHSASWRHPRAEAGATLDVDRYIRLARKAEQAKFDLIFLADALNIRERGGIDALSSSDHVVFFEPAALLSALAVATTHIGLVGSASTTFNEPYHLARQFSSLDHLSKGRAGWNLVTSFTDTEAHHFGQDKILPHAQRYDRAVEFVDVLKQLWDTWGDEAFVYDKASGRYFRPEHFHPIAHQGKHFSVHGALTLARSPQGYPVIVQAGSSDTGIDVAARTAEVVFTVQDSLQAGQAFYRTIKDRVRHYGRQASDLLVLPGLFFIVGDTRAQAREKLQELHDLIVPGVGLGHLSSLIGHDLSAYPLDGPVPDLPESDGQKARSRLFLSIAKREKLTIRQLMFRTSIARGHITAIGTASDVADTIETWFRHEAADGFNILPSFFPDGLDDFADQVVPILQERGLFRTEYESKLLRGNLGLSRPANQYESAPSMGAR